MARSVSLLRLGPLLLLGLCACGALENPKKGITVAIEAPPAVTQGEAFEIRAIVTNRSEKPATLDSIDIGDSFLEGVSITLAEPPWIDTAHLPIDNTVSHEFQATVPAGQSLTVTFHAKAAQLGHFDGDFDICVNSMMNCFFEQISIETR